MTKQLSFPGERLASLLEKVYLILLGSYLMLGTLRTTSLEYRTPPFFTAVIAAGLLIIIAAKFFFFHVYSIKEAVLYTAIFAVILIVVLRNHHDTLMMLFLLVIASKGIEFRKIVVVQLIAVTEVLLFAAVLSQIGIATDYGVTYVGISLKAFGVCNTTDFASYILFLVFGYTFLRGNRITLAELALFLAGDAWVYKQTHARTAFYSLLLFCILVFLYKLMIKFSIDFAKLRIESVGITVMPLLSFFMIGLSLFYSDKNPLMIKMDTIATYRISLGHTGIERYGIHLFGNAVLEQGYGFGEQPITPTDYFYLDSSYMRLLLIDGLLVYGIVMLVYFFIYKKLIAGKNHIGIIIFFALAITCVPEQHLMEPWYNPFTLLCLAELTSPKGKSLDEKHRVSGSSEKE